MAELVRTHKNTVKAAIRKDGAWSGYLAPSNAAPYHITSGWHVGCHVTVSSVKELNRVSANFAYYNCNNEMGRYVTYWSER